jgi:tetratricopeptide (TPR) repeat protein
MVIASEVSAHQPQTAPQGKFLRGQILSRSQNRKPRFSFSGCPGGCYSGNKHNQAPGTLLRRAMAKTRSKKQPKMANGKGSTKSQQSPEQLYAAAIELVEQHEPAEALKKAKKLWVQVQNSSVTEALPALNLLGEISVELGDVDGARQYFEEAVKLDPTGEVPEALGGGAEKFLWLAQLCEEGGKASVEWFEKGINALQHEIAVLESGAMNSSMDEEALLLMRVEKKRKLANALCGIVEVYMTDLSWENDAEARCESLITQAMTVEDETSPEVLQTLASVRLSQERKEDAQSALSRSLATWKDLDSEDLAVPDFATRISLSRLLMEAEMEEDAMKVLQRLVLDDDQSVEAWYLGGWCQYLIAQKLKADGGNVDMTDGATGAPQEQGGERAIALKGSRNWLKQSLKLYDMLDYEDERLFEHAKELVAELDTVLGPDGGYAEGGAAVNEDDEWEEWGGIEDGEEEDVEGDADGDEEMKDS